MAHGLQFQVAYTWAKSIDDNSSTIAGDTFGNGLNSLYYFAPKSLRGLSDYTSARTHPLTSFMLCPRQSLSTVCEGAVVGGRWWHLQDQYWGSDYCHRCWRPSGFAKFRCGPIPIPNLVPGCDPVNHNYIGSTKPIYINTSCYTLPAATPAIASQCMPFGFVGHNPSKTPDPFKPGIAGTCAKSHGQCGPQHSHWT